MGSAYMPLVIFVLCSQIFIGLIADKKETVRCPEGDWVQSGTSCYLFLLSSLGWNEAQKECETKHGTLTMFESPSELTKIFIEIDKHQSEFGRVERFWIGAHKQGGDGVFRWADGSEVTRPNWRKFLEGATGGDCVYGTPGGSGASGKNWGLADCSEEMSYICEVKPGSARWSGWGVWSECSQTCGEGPRSRSRSCLSPAGASGTCQGATQDTQQCSSAECPAVWQEWQQWGDCSVTCGDGERERTRECLEKDKKNCKGSTSDKEACTMPACPVWQEWQQWGDCSVTCGDGERERTRECLEKDKKNCKGSTSDKEACTMPACPVWQEWQQWGDCSVTCGDGERERTRECLEKDKKNCKGSTSDKEACTMPACPVWKEWQQWDDCSVTCGDGERERTRECLEKDKKNCKGSTSDKEACTMPACPVWQEWQQWGDCSVTCGDGERERTRECLEKDKKNCKGSKSDKEACTLPACPVWQEWQQWGYCSVTCGDGERERTRDCLEKDKKNCKGSKSDKEACTMPACPVWGTWNPWSSCSATCGKSLRTRSRTCSNKGACDGDLSQSKQCSEPRCGDEAEWSRWGWWGSCSVSCGVGTRVRQRQCRDGEGRDSPSCKGVHAMSRRCLSPCSKEEDVRKLLLVAAPDEVHDLKKILHKLSRREMMKEEIFTGTDMEDFVIVGHELSSGLVDRPLSCAMLCIRYPSCQSFNYEDKRDANNKIDLSQLKNCVLNSVNREEAGDDLERKSGYILFDLGPFFI